MRLWSKTNFRYLSLVQADSMDQETQTKVTFMCSRQCATETRFWYRELKPRSNFCIGIGAEFFFFQNRNFKILEIFLIFFCLWDISFKKLEIEQKSSKIIKKNVWQQIWFKGSFMRFVLYDWKNTPYYSLIQKNGYTFAIVYSSKCVSVFLNQTLLITLKCGFGIGFGIGWKYWPLQVLVSNLNQNSGFGRTPVLVLSELDRPFLVFKPSIFGSKSRTIYTMN